MTELERLEKRIDDMERLQQALSHVTGLIVVEIAARLPKEDADAITAALQEIQRIEAPPKETTDEQLLRLAQAKFAAMFEKRLAARRA